MKQTFFILTFAFLTFFAAAQQSAVTVTACQPSTGQTTFGSTGAPILIPWATIICTDTVHHLIAASGHLTGLKNRTGDAMMRSLVLQTDNDGGFVPIADQFTLTGNARILRDCPATLDFILSDQDFGPDTVEVFLDSLAFDDGTVIATSISSGTIFLKSCVAINWFEPYAGTSGMPDDFELCDTGSVTLHWTTDNAFREAYLSLPSGTFGPFTGDSATIQIGGASGQVTCTMTAIGIENDTARKIVAFDVDDCSGTGTATGINEIAAGKVQIFPNPATSFIEVRSGSGENSRVELFSSDGKILFEEEYSSKTRIDMRSFASGIYFIKPGDKPLQKIVKM